MNIPYNVAQPLEAINVPTTDGEMFVFFIEDERGDCVRVMIMIGKTGTAIHAWTAALTEIVNIALDKGVKLMDICNSLSNIYTDKSVYLTKDRRIYSGPDGFVYAINRYIRTKYAADVVPFDMPWVD